MWKIIVGVIILLVIVAIAYKKYYGSETMLNKGRISAQREHLDLPKSLAESKKMMRSFSNTLARKFGHEDAGEHFTTNNAIGTFDVATNKSH